MIRKWTSRFRKSIDKRAVSRRREINMPITITFEPDKNTGSLQKPISELSIRGETRDLSDSGIGFVVSSIRINEFYLVGEGRLLNAEIGLPGGKVKMQLVGQRYKQVGQHVSASEYLVGAKIMKMTDGDRKIYTEFLKKKRIKGGTLELGIDEG